MTLKSWVFSNSESIEDKLTDNPNHFFCKSAFLDLFLNFLIEKSENDDELESLDWSLRKAKVPGDNRAPLLCLYVWGC